MRHRALIALLALGTIAGYSSGFASLHHWHRYCHAFHSHDSNAAPWAPPQAPRPGEAPQQQARATPAPAEPGPR